MPFTQDLAASLASGDRASTRNFVSPLPHHSVHSCTYTHLYLYTIPLLFFLPQEFACAAHVLCSQCLGCSAQCWSTSTATTHKRGTPQRFSFSENLALLETYNRLGPPQLDLPSCTAYQTGHHSANILTYNTHTCILSLRIWYDTGTRRLKKCLAWCRLAARPTAS